MARIARRGRVEEEDSRYSKILVELSGGSELLDSGFVFAEGCVDETDICEDLAGVGDLGEEFKALLKVLLVVGGEGSGPSLELSLERHGGMRVVSVWGGYGSGKGDDDRGMWS